MATSASARVHTDGLFSGDVSTTMLLSSFADRMRQPFEADACLLYLDADPCIIGVKSPPIIGNLTLAHQLVLAASSGIFSDPPTTLPSRLPADILTTDNRPRLITELPQGIKELLPHRAGSTWIALDSPKQIICHGLFLLNLSSSKVSSLEEGQGAYWNAINHFLPILEAILRREIQHLTGRLHTRAGTNKATPTTIFRQAFNESCRSLGAAGGTLFAKLVGHDATALQVLATTRSTPLPNPLPYKPIPSTPTTAAVLLNRNCFLPDTLDFRATTSNNLGQPVVPPLCPDILDDASSHSLLFAFHATDAGSIYILRLTNSLRNPTHHFHTLDLLQAQHLVLALSLLHRALETEFRAIRFFMNLWHEFNQKLQKIQSSAEYVQRALLRNINPEERFHKLNHIQDTVTEVTKLLTGFRFPQSASTADLTKAIVPIRPYADLVRPVCESWFQSARKRNILFYYDGKNQLGLLYADLHELTQIVDNLISNAVKYTYEGEPIYIRLQRLPKAGGLIHIMSKSLPVDLSEAEHLFDPRFRTKAAKEHCPQGSGLGLTIAKLLMSPELCVG